MRVAVTAVVVFAASGTATATEPTTTTCVPKELVNDEHVALQLGAIEGKPMLCAVNESIAVAEPVACWDIDVKARKLASTTPRLLPGWPVVTKLVNGCAGSYCVPKTDKVDPKNEVSIGINDTGERAVLLLRGGDVGVSMTAYVFDRSSSKLLGKYPFGGWSSAQRTLFVGNYVVIDEAAAGPLATPMFYELAAKPGDYGINLPDNDQANTYLGSISLVSPGKLLFAEGGLVRVFGHDMAANKTTRLHKRKLAGCIGDFIDEPKCPKKFASDVAPYESAQYVSIGKNQYLALLKRGELAVLDKKFKKTAKLSAYCKK